MNLKVKLRVSSFDVEPNGGIGAVCVEQNITLIFSFIPFLLDLIFCSLLGLVRPT
jgi:hypothetical protein